MLPVLALKHQNNEVRGPEKFLFFKGNFFRKKRELYFLLFLLSSMDLISLGNYFLLKKNIIVFQYCM